MTVTAGVHHSNSSSSSSLGSGDVTPSHHQKKKRKELHSDDGDADHCDTVTATTRNTPATTTTTTTTNTTTTTMTSKIPILYQRPLEVIYQDACMAIIHKPQGMTVMGGRPSLIRCDLLMPLVGNNNNSSISSTPTLSPSDRILGKPRPAHRLDSATGGLLVVAKTTYADRQLSMAFMNRACRKRYRALLVGKLEVSTSTSTTSELPPYTTRIDDDDSTPQAETPAAAEVVIQADVTGKTSQTYLRVVRHMWAPSSAHWYTMVDLWPVTGRKHQLRKHMKLIGYSIYGDTRYMAPAVLAAARTTTTTTLPPLCLWAMEITVPHPYTGVDLTCVLPNHDDPDWFHPVLFPSHTTTDDDDNNNNNDAR